MTACAKCGEPIQPSGPRAAIRSGDDVYHVACAPAALVESALEEYRAILRKGVRYFVEKYGTLPSADPDLGLHFLELGRALEAEQHRRGAS